MCMRSRKPAPAPMPCPNQITESPKTTSRPPRKSQPASTSPNPHAGGRAEQKERTPKRRLQKRSLRQGLKGAAPPRAGKKGGRFRPLCLVRGACSRAASVLFVARVRALRRCSVFRPMLPPRCSHSFFVSVGVCAVTCFFYFPIVLKLSCPTPATNTNLFINWGFQIPKKKSNPKKK